MADLQIVPAATGKNVEAQYVEMRVPLYSYGCERKLKKALSHLRGIYSVTVDYGQQKMTVWGICDKNDVLTSVRKKRKDAKFWNPEDNIEEENGDKISSTANEEEEHCLPSKPTHYSYSVTPVRSLSFSLSRARSISLKWKAWKKIFKRSNSF